MEVKNSGGAKETPGFFAALDSELRDLSNEGPWKVSATGFPPCMLPTHDVDSEEHPYTMDASIWTLQPRLWNEEERGGRELPECSTCVWRVGCSGVPRGNRLS